MFAFVSAFPKSLHCTDEAQQAETVLSAVLSIYIYLKRFKVEANEYNADRKTHFQDMISLNGVSSSTLQEIHWEQ